MSLPANTTAQVRVARTTIRDTTVPGELGACRHAACYEQIDSGESYVLVKRPGNFLRFHLECFQIQYCVSVGTLSAFSPLPNSSQ